MKIAVITDDLKTISNYFASAQHYLVFNSENGKITGQELRLKSSNTLAGRESGTGYPNPNYVGPDYTKMMGTIIDCEVLLTREMEKTAYDGLKIRNIQPIITDIQDVQAAIDAYLSGDIVDHSEGLH